MFNNINQHAQTIFKQKRKPETIRIWTIQPRTVWDNLRKNKTLLVDPTHASFNGNSEPEMLAAYNWLCNQMALFDEKYKGNYPWWGYTHFLDLRRYRDFYYHHGTRSVRIELALATERVLLSSYSDWELVLVRNLIHTNDNGEYEYEEYDNWHDGLIESGKQTNNPYPEPWESQMLASWERIFEVDTRYRGHIIQANFEELRLKDVVQVTEFTSIKMK